MYKKMPPYQLYPVNDFWSYRVTVSARTAAVNGPFSVFSLSVLTVFFQVNLG